jgi:Heterokaryon incompatibility protein (HET)
MQDPISDETMDTIRYWLGKCVDLHAACSKDLNGDILEKEPELPTRIIQITGTPRLIESIGRKGRFAALSHCWGGHLSCMTTRSNLAEHLVALDTAQLSKNVSDAIYVTRKLGIEYLWVDSIVSKGE